MSQSLRWLLTAAVVLIVGASASEATKCPYARYVVEGKIIIPEGIAASNIRVYLFLEGAQLTSDYPQGPKDEEYAIPDSEGFFKIEARLNTEKSGRCRRFVEGGQLFIIGDELRALRKEVVFRDAKRAIRRDFEVTTEGIQVHLVPRY